MHIPFEVVIKNSNSTAEELGDETSFISKKSEGRDYSSRLNTYSAEFQVSFSLPFGIISSSTKRVAQLLRTFGRVVYSI